MFSIHGQAPKRLSPFLVFLTTLSTVIASLFLLFWLADFGRYTSVGVDSDSRQDAYVIQRYYRTRWIGDGSFWVGHGQYSFRSHPSYQFMPFDWGGRFFQRTPRLIPPRSLWNRIGFWRYRIPPAAGSDPELMPQESWLAIPGWIPVLLFASPVIAVQRRRKSRGEIGVAGEATDQRAGK